MLSFFFLACTLSQTYDVQDLGTFASSLAPVQVAAVNNRGHAAGWIKASKDRAFFWDGSTLTEIVPATYYELQARDLNDDDLVVGGHAPSFTWPPSGSFLWQNGVLTEFHVGTQTFSAASGVNQAGWVCGYYDGGLDPWNFNQIVWGFVRSPQGVVTDLPSNYGWTETTAINDFGTAVGFSEDEGLVWHAPVGLADVIAPPGHLHTEAFDVDSWDVVVGRTFDANVLILPFSWESGVLTLLPTLGGSQGEANAIADDGTIVGWSQKPNNVHRACLWQGGVVTDLQTLIPSGTGWELEEATDVNELGEIVGTGKLNGLPRAWKLTPILQRPRLSGITPPAAGRSDRVFGLGFQPGASVTLVASLQAGSTAVPGCAGLVVDLAAPVVVATTTADADGRLEVPVGPPASLAGATVHLQAADLANCVVSDPVVHDLR